MAESDITSTDITAELDFLAKKFAVLLTESNLDLEVQEALMSSIPHLEPEEMFELVSILEAKYTTSKTVILDNELKTTLAKVADQFTARQQARDAALVKELNNLAETIN